MHTQVQKHMNLSFIISRYWSGSGPAVVQEENLCIKIAENRTNYKSTKH